MPNQEQFDFMNDAKFCDWWDVWFDAQCAAATSEDEVEQADQVMKAAFDARFGE